MRPDELASILPQQSGAQVAREPLGLVVRVGTAHLEGVITALRDTKPVFDMLIDLFGTDTGEGVELTYHLRRVQGPDDVFVKCVVPYDGELASVWRCYPAALYPEREAAELLGVSFAGHPNPKRLLTTDEVDVYLLRKSTPIRQGDEMRRHD